MAISSNSLMHFTDSKDALKGILADNFKIKYCKETIKLGSSKPLTYHVPMISFCEIPLAQIKEHIDKYGCYGIGLTRNWALKNRLNPVFYVEPDSYIAHNFRTAFLYFSKLKNVDEGYDENHEKLIDLFRYIKNYQGDLVRREKTHKNYRFADEREWRFVPDICKEHLMLYAKDMNDAKKQKAASTVAGIRLKFEPEDIKYIFIKEDSEISEFVRHLDDAKGANFTKREVERLTTRIITTEQIRTDV